jgi:uncharacterized protein YozE (UPF0346 family)
MVTLEDLKTQIELHAEGTLTLEDLAAWAETVFREEEFEAEHADFISEVLETIRNAVDPHRFRWEVPDFDEMWNQIEDLAG